MPQISTYNPQQTTIAYWQNASTESGIKEQLKFYLDRYSSGIKLEIKQFNDGLNMRELYRIVSDQEIFPGASQKERRERFCNLTELVRALDYQINPNMEDSFLEIRLIEILQQNCTKTTRFSFSFLELEAVDFMHFRNPSMELHLRQSADDSWTVSRAGNPETQFPDWWSLVQALRDYQLK